MKSSNENTIIDKYLLSLFCIVAFVCHGWIMFNHYPSYSGLTLFVNNTEVQIREGRWLSAFIKTYFNGGHTLPWFIGVQSIFFLSLTAVFVLKIYDIKNRYLGILVGTIIISSPIVSCTYVFMHDANSYNLALLLSTIAVWCLYNNRKLNGLCYAVLIALSLSLYQTYIAYAIVLIIVYEMNELLKTVKVEERVKKWVEYILWTGIAMVIYVVVNKIVQWLTHIQATNTMDFAHSLHELRERLVQCYKSFALFWWGESFFKQISWLLVVMILLLVVMTAILFAKQPKKVAAIKCIILFVIVLILPVITFFIHLISSERNYNSCIRMCAGSIPLLFVLCIFSDSVYKDENSGSIKIGCKCIPAKKILVFAGMLMSIMLIVFQFTLANTIYMNMHLRYEKEYSLALRIVNRVEEQPEYKEGIVLYVIMDGDETLFSSNESILDEFLKNTDGAGVRLMSTPTGLKMFMDQFMKTDIEIGPGRGNISDEELDCMPCFPKEGSIKYKDGEMYIKL